MGLVLEAEHVKVNQSAAGASTIQATSQATGGRARHNGEWQSAGAAERDGRHRSSSASGRGGGATLLVALVEHPAGVAGVADRPHQTGLAQRARCIETLFCRSPRAAAISQTQHAVRPPVRQQAQDPGPATVRRRRREARRLRRRRWTSGASQRSQFTLI
jgi:hypothetical protein